LKLVSNDIESNDKNHEIDTEMFEAIINNFKSMVKNRYGINIKNSALSMNNSPINNYLKVTDAVRELLTFCMDYTPSNGIVIITESRVCDLEAWKHLLKSHSSLKRMVYSKILKQEVNLTYPKGDIMFGKNNAD
jgi:hypothetical protein